MQLARSRSTENTISCWKSKYAGKEVPEAKRLRGLEAESAKLKRLLAEPELDKAAPSCQWARTRATCSARVDRARGIPEASLQSRSAADPLPALQKDLLVKPVLYLSHYFSLIYVQYSGRIRVSDAGAAKRKNGEAFSAADSRPSPA